MFIATGRTPKDLAPLGAKRGSRTFTGAAKSDCAPTKLRNKERPQAINISPRWGEATNNCLLHFLLEFAVSRNCFPYSARLKPRSRNQFQCLR